MTRMAVAITDATMAKAQAADAVIFGAVGGPKWDKVPYDVRPEAGLLRLRKDLGLFANLRPAVCYPALADASSLKREVVEGLDIMIVRELTGGVYFGEPKTITDLGNGQKRAIDTQVYDTYEIERIARVAFELARKRRNKVTSMEKRNVMKTGVLWNEVVTQVHKRANTRTSARASARRFRRHAAGALAEAVRRHRHRQSVRRHAVRRRGDADRLARHAAVGLARRGRSKTKKRKALYEPVHGSAPDIAGKGAANPIAPEIARDQFVGLPAALQREHAAQPADAQRHHDARRHSRPAQAFARLAGNGAQLPLDTRAQKIGDGFGRQLAQKPAHRPRRLEPPPAIRAGFQAELEVGALARRQLAVDIGVDLRLTGRAVHGPSFPAGRAIRPPASRAPAPGAT
jgi:hypothetical protein